MAALYRVTVECEAIVEAKSASEAEDKVLDEPVRYVRPVRGITVLDQTVPCDKHGEEMEDVQTLQPPKRTA